MRTRPVTTGLIRLALSLAAVFAMSAAFAQDSPTLKGGNARTGLTTDPTTGGPGAGYLRWFKPDNASNIHTLVRDNLAASTQPSEIVEAGSWNDPTAGQESGFFYVPQAIQN